ncbi:MAG: MarR family transcriptional regulator [Candidatus Hodarchaeota archaeon]
MKWSRSHREPPSASKIIRVIKNQGPLTSKEIVQNTQLAPRTVRYALKRLVAEGVVARVPNLTDLRQTLFMLHIERRMNR